MEAAADAGPPVRPGWQTASDDQPNPAGLTSLAGSTRTHHAPRALVEHLVKAIYHVDKYLNHK